MNVIPWARHTKLDIYVLFWFSSIYTMVVPDECYSMSTSYKIRYLRFILNFQNLYHGRTGWMLFHERVILN